MKALPPKPDGFNWRETPSGFTAVEIDYWADPGKKESGWVADMEKLLEPRKFRRDVMRDWDAGEGENFYPEFHTWGGKQMFVRTSPGILAGLPIYRGWDGGFKFPACVWFQYAPKQDLVWVIREIMPTNIHIDDFRDLVLYLSGQMDVRFLRHGTAAWVERIRETPGLPAPPWFVSTGVPYNFVDFAGPEFLRPNTTTTGDKAANTDAQILADGGVQLSIFASSPKDRSRVIRRLLRPRSNSNPVAPGLPSLLIDPSCSILIRGLAGGITHPAPTKNNPYPDADEPRKDGYFDNVADAFGYALINVVPATDPELGKIAHTRNATGLILHGRPVAPIPDDDMGFYETRRHQP